MTADDFVSLSTQLRELAKQIPLRWGAVQNDGTDHKLDLFSLDGFDQLESAIAKMTDDDKNYWRRRWYLWKCSQCDEYLFYCLPGTEKNPNPCDKTWDIRIHRNIEFDIKGTVIPKRMRSDVQKVISDPREMIDFFYDEQSNGVRYDIQNRLFLVHHSFVDEDRELYLRSAWGSKQRIYQEYVENIGKISFYRTHNVYASVIFIFEKTRSKVDYQFFGMNS